MYWIKVYDVPQGSRISRGKPIVNLLPLEDREKITALLPINLWRVAEMHRLTRRVRRARRARIAPARGFRPPPCRADQRR